MKIQILASLCFILTSCVNLQKEPETDFPVEPTLKIYQSSPVLEKINENFLVTPELIYNSTMLKDYYKRINAWKEKHNIR